MLELKVAKKVRFDERFIWSWETDFGYRLTKLGKMKYVPKAIVYHYHRPDPKSFFRQQMKNAMMSPLIYWKHPDKVRGDHISTSGMALTLLLFYAVIITALLALFIDIFLPIYSILVLLFFFYIMIQVVMVARKPSDFFPLTSIYIIRTLAWSVGIPKGILMFIKNKWYKS